MPSNGRFKNIFGSLLEQVIIDEDISGDIVEVGEGVTNINKGDRVSVVSLLAVG